MLTIQTCRAVLGESAKNLTDEQVERLLAILACHSNANQNTSLTTRGYVRPDELAPVLGVSPRTIRNWQQRGVLPFRKIGRVILFDLNEVMQALDKFKIDVTVPKSRVNRKMTPFR